MQRAVIGYKNLKERGRNKWFDRRRDYFVTGMLKVFHRTAAFFLQIYQDYLKTGTVPYGKIDKLVGTENRKGSLWQLKDACHQLWRTGDSTSKIDSSLLDWVIGSIFHEAMKLKENIYLLEYYAPLAQDIKGKWIQEIRKFCGLECRCFMEKIFHEVRRQIENIGVMFGRASFLLRSMLPEHADNLLLLRYLIEHPDVVSELWSEALDEIFNDMFHGVPERGYCFAGLSYFEGNWYEKSLKAFQEALRVNERCNEAVLWTRQLKAMMNKTQGKQQGNPLNTVTVNI